MSFGKKITALWTSITRPQAAPAPEPTSYGVIIRSEAKPAAIIDPLFVAQATPIAEKVVEVLKQNGVKDDAVEVTIGALETVAPHQGVRFEASLAVAQAVANTLPNHIIVRSDCLVICPQQGRGQVKRCEID